MDIVAQNLPIQMVRETLEDCPVYDLPPGYGLRWYEPGDEAQWLDIHELADLYDTFSLAYFWQEFPATTADLSQRQCYLLNPDGQPIGTATAWFTETGNGLIHWVAILPIYQGQGLGRPLLSAVCRRLRQLGHTGAELTTATVRLPAINLYLRFGFRPDIRSEEDLAIWQAIAALGQTPLLSQ